VDVSFLKNDAYLTSTIFEKKGNKQIMTITLDVQDIVSTLFGEKWIQKYGSHPDIQWNLLSETMTNKTSTVVNENDSIQSTESQEFIELLVSACINLRSRHLV